MDGKKNIYSSTTGNPYLKYWINSGLSFALILSAFSIEAAQKVFTVKVNQTVILERTYEVKDINLTILKDETDGSFLEEAIIQGEVGLDAVSGRMIVEINSLSKAGITMKVVGYIEDEDKEKGINACTLWQTRMFEESKLCYTAEVAQGKQFKVVITVEDGNVLPSVTGQ